MMKISRFLLILALAAFAFAGPAYAQGSPKAGKETIAQLIQSYQLKNQQLQAIQHKALKNDPKLAAEMKHFENEVNTSMRAHGYDLVEGHKRMQAMAAKLNSNKNMSKAERMSTMKSMQDERARMMKARAAVVQEPQIKKDGNALQRDMIAAMKKQDSHASQLLKDVKILRTRIIATMAAHRAPSK